MQNQNGKQNLRLGDKSGKAELPDRDWFGFVYKESTFALIGWTLHESLWVSTLENFANKKPIKKKTNTANSFCIKTYTHKASSFFQQTRAQAILQKSVKQQKQAAKSTDVLTNAEKWGIQVKPVEQVLKWIDAQKKHQASAQPIGRVYNLRGSFLKVEDHSR